ncbi:hypothetical protein AHAS_Ahas09G0040800 [Arachis hypogaea]
MAHQNHALNTQTVTYGRLSTSSTSSTSQSALKTRKPSHFRAKIKVQNIQIVVRNLHQNTIKLSVKNLKRKQSNNTQRKFIKIPVYFTFLLRRFSRVYYYSFFLLHCSKFYVALLSSTSFYVVVLSSPAIVVDFLGQQKKSKNCKYVSFQKTKPVFFLNCSGVFFDLLWVYFRLSLADSNMMVVREQTPSEALAVVPIQVFVPASQTTTETDFEPTPMLRIEGTIETTPEPPKQLQETTPKLPPAPTKIHPAAEDAAALLMMARTATYVPKTDPEMPSFSLGLTDSRQEGASTQETKGKISRNCKFARTIRQFGPKISKQCGEGKKRKSTNSEGDWGRKFCKV